MPKNTNTIRLLSELEADFDEACCRSVRAPSLSAGGVVKWWRAACVVGIGCRADRDTTIDEKEHGLSGCPVFERDGDECEWNSMVDDTHEWPPGRAEEAKGTELRLY